MKGRAAAARDRFSPTSEPITSLGLMMSQSSRTGPVDESNTVILTVPDILYTGVIYYEQGVLTVFRRFDVHLELQEWFSCRDKRSI